jgi:excisionase family DNA binding protein
VDPAVDEQLDLQSAADELGVHYQTAYRWVRSGRLGAEMVDGRYLVPRAEMTKLDQSRRAPKRPPAPKARRLDHAAERMYEALLAGDETAATRTARRLTEEGAPIVDLVQDVLVPPLRRLGQQWQEGTVTIWTEHRASAIVERMLGGLAPNPLGRRRGGAVVAALSGDRHSLPTTMAAVALRSDNWLVHHLGADLPPEQLIAFCAEHEVALAVITVTQPDVQRFADATALELRAAGTPTIVGGAGHDLDELIDRARSARS